MLDTHVITTNGEPGNTRLQHFLAQWFSFTDQGITIHHNDVADNPHEGCWEAHREVMRHATGPIAIFEDDAEFLPDFNLDILLPDDWDMFYFGAQHMRRPLPWASGVVRCVRVHATHAYAIRDPRQLAELIGTGNEAKPHHDISHRLQRIVRNNKFHVYAVHPLTVGQSASTSVISPNFTRLQADFWGGERAEPVEP